MNIEEFIAKLQEKSELCNIGAGGGCGTKRTSGANTGCC